MESVSTGATGIRLVEFGKHIGNLAVLQVETTRWVGFTAGLLVFLVLVPPVLFVRWFLLALSKNFYRRKFSTIAKLQVADRVGTFAFVHWDPYLVARLINEADAKASASPSTPDGFVRMDSWLGGPDVIITSLDAVRLINVSKPTKFKRARQMRRAMGLMIGYNGILLSDGKEYMRARRVVSPAMHFEAVIKTAPILLAESDKLLERIGADHRKLPNEPICFKELFGAATFSVILRFCTGRFWSDINDDQIAKLRKAYADSLQFGRNVIWRVLTQIVVDGVLPTDWFAVARQEKMLIRSMVLDILRAAVRKQEKAITEEGGHDEHDTALLSLMVRDTLNDGGRLTENEMVDNVLSFLTAGQATTAILLQWLMYVMAKYPQWLTRIQAEIAPLQAHAGDDPQKYLRELDNLPILERVIKETLRLYPPVAQALRQLPQDVEFNGITLPADTVVRMPILAIHTCEKYWDRPLEFDPDRFLPDRQQGRDPMAYCPFLYGLRSCIGQRMALLETKVFAAAIFEKYDVYIDENDPAPFAEGSLPAPKGMRVFVRPRHS